MLLRDLIDAVEEGGQQPTGGKWLEEATRRASTLIRDWDIAECWSWADWPDRRTYFPNSSSADIGIDLVARRASYAEYIAIQCKARRLDASGEGNPISKPELDSFASVSASDAFAERWVVTNGNVAFGGNATAAFSTTERPLKLLNLAHELQQQAATERAELLAEETCEHCAFEARNGIDDGVTQLDWTDDSATEPLPPRQTKSCMQREAVSEAVRILQEHSASDSGGLPKGQARGKVILPCGTGKTRISLRIVEELTPRGGLSVVLCPSIALVAQIRREYLQHKSQRMRALAVCSDQTAGYDPKKEDKHQVSNDPTADASNVSAAEVKGLVTTDADVIAEWISHASGTDAVNVIFGTYQSGHRVATALKAAGATVSVLVADEAHRTAGLPRSRKRDAATKRAEDDHLRDFALCHDQDAFPARYRVYQTATPRVYGAEKARIADENGWIVRSMDDERVFGVDLYRKSYLDAVRNDWLADYRIIAIGVNDRAAYERANQLAEEAVGSGKNPLTTSDNLRGLAYAMAMGGTTDAGGDTNVEIKSCIAFMNTVAKSKRMAVMLQSDGVRNWLQDWLDNNTSGGRIVSAYSLEHVDATSNVAARDQAKSNLASASAGDADPHGVINVGIFGEGTDSPTLTAVAFLEPRKSPIDVIQAVGRAMRTAEGKEYGYIVVPILIPPNADPEEWLKTSTLSEWPELGQILLALRAHDSRIEDEIEELLEIYLPEPPDIVTSFVAIGNEDGSVDYYEHDGNPGTVQADVERALDRGGDVRTLANFRPVLEPVDDDVVMVEDDVRRDVPTAPVPIDEQPTQIVTGKKTPDGEKKLRIDTVQRRPCRKDETRGQVDIDKTKKHSVRMLNEDAGTETRARKVRPKGDIFTKEAFAQLEWGENADAIKMNLLARSGLTSDKVKRDLNLLEGGVKEAAYHLHEDGMKPVLDKHFGLDNLQANQKRADGATIAALLMMNAAMLHQRIANGRWMTGVNDLLDVASSTNVVTAVERQWNSIISRDFKPVIEPALKVIHAIEDTGRLAGLERALRHLASEAARIAETYADMGADHAGALFNRVMGDQSSDGAFFTRPVAASLLARLALDAAEPDNVDPETGELTQTDWTDPATWRRNRAVDLACGSGTLLAALLTDMKRRAKEQGATERLLGELHKLAVEETLKGMDINPVSLQLAASRLTAGNHDIAFRQMGLHLMPYGPTGHGGQVAAGTLELLAQSAIVGRGGKMAIPDNQVASRNVWGDGRRDDPEMEDAVDAAKDARIVVMNPPFTNRAKMGEKFPSSAKSRLQERVDHLRQGLSVVDAEMEKFGDTNSIGHLFVALADNCAGSEDAVVAMVEPTVTLANPSGLGKRLVWADRFHIHTVLTCHDPRDLNLSENTNINESIIIAKRRVRRGQPTRFISLDRLPGTESEVDELFEAISRRGADGVIPGGWGQISDWPSDRVAVGDWTSGIWRSPELAEASHAFSNSAEIVPLRDTGLVAVSTSATIRAAAGYRLTDSDDVGSFRGLRSSGEDGQKTIEAQPDAVWVRDDGQNDGFEDGSDTIPYADPVLNKAGHLLITGGQDAKGARLTAVAAARRYVGTGWLPVAEADEERAKALAVFINSTPGRIQLMRIVGRKLSWPKYWPAGINSIRIPDPTDARKMRILADCWERTKDMLVPQFGEGECEVRQLWDDAVAEAMDWDPAELTRLRLLLHREPHVSGRRYGHFAG